MSTVLGACEPERGVQALADQHRAVTQRHGGPVAQACDACAGIQFPPMLACRTCGSAELSWIACGATGTIGTYVTVHTRHATPSMSIPRRLLDQVPYTSVYVVPDAVPTVRLPALMTGPQQERLAVGAAVTLSVAESPALVADLAG